MAVVPAAVQIQSDRFSVVAIVAAAVAVDVALSCWLM